MQIPALSREFVPVEIVTPKKDGKPYDPAGDSVEMAFVPRGSRPALTDWVSGQWFSEGSGFSARYFAACLVGPGAKALAAGTYVIWVRITDNPEVPVLEAPELLVIT